MNIRNRSSEYSRAVVAAAAFAVGALTGLPPAARSANAPIPAADTIIYNARVFDGHTPTLLEGARVSIAGNKIVAVEKGAAAPDAADPGIKLIDAGGRVLMPGLIDAHTHASNTAQGDAARDLDASYLTALSIVEARRTLMRGFTSIRDLGGPVFGLKRAIDEGVVEGPRIFPAGAMVSQTSGHGDGRQRRSGSRRFGGPLDVMETAGYGIIADGPAEVMAAVREQLRLGATQIKVSAGGGISSTSDPLDSVQYTPQEMAAAVAAAADWGTYVTVHAYTPEAIRRAIEAGVRSVDHGHLIDEPTMKLMAERGVILSPQAFRFSPAFRAAPRAVAGEKLSPVAEAARAKGAMVRAGLDRMMALAKRYRVKVVLGTDLAGTPEQFALQSRELGARLRWFTSAEVLEQATGNNGDLLALSGPRNHYGQVGVIAPGALADLLIVDGNPVEDVRMLEDSERHIRVIMKDGQLYRNTL